VATLTPVMSIAGSGLLPDAPGQIGTALSLPTDLSNAVNSYANVAIVSALSNVCANAASFVNAVPALMSESVLLGLLDLGSNNFPALTNTLPGTTVPTDVVVNGLLSPWDNATAYTPGTYVTYLNNVYVSVLAGLDQTPASNSEYWNIVESFYKLSNNVLLDANTIMGGGDLSKFCQVFQSAEGYIKQSNNTLNSVKSTDVLAQTFNSATGGMNTLTTAGLNQVSNNLEKFSADLLQIGQLINLSRLDYLGLPSELLGQISRVTGGVIPSINELLLAVNLTSNQIRSLGTDDAVFDATTEKRLYGVLRSVTGTTLEQVLAVLGVKLTGLTNAAQLLNPRIILPNSYLTLLCPTDTGLKSIYITSGSNTGANASLVPVVANPGVSAYTGPSATNSYSILKLIIPPEQALANKALARSMQQVKNIAASNLPALAKAMSLVETNIGLTAVLNLTTPVPSYVGSFYKQALGSGTGPGNTFILKDVIGVVTDPMFVNSYSNLTTSIASMNTVPLGNVYTYMNNTIAGDYNDPEPATTITIPSGPAAGTYANINAAFTDGLIPAANSAISNLVTAYSSINSSTTYTVNNVITELQREIANQSQAEINFGLITGNSSSATMGFAASLHDYGLQNDTGGAAQVLTALANTASLSGQCIVASLREGRNIASLQEAGIQFDTQVQSSVTVVPVTNTTSSTTVPWSQISNAWSKSATLTASDRNWGLYRSWLGSQVTNWGFDGTGEVSGTVAVTASGKNVDIIIVDGVIDPNHPEFALNANGSGGTRVKYFNWYGLNLPGDPAAGTVYDPPITTTAPNSADDSRHGTHVAGIAAGNTQGWAPNANIYNISPQYVTGGVQYTYLYQYILAWHNQKIANGNKTPTIVNNSWYSRYTVPYTSITAVNYRGTSYAGPFTIGQLLSYGITVNSSNQAIVALSNSTMNQQIESCISAGIVMVACAGNDDTRISVSGDVDYNNTLTATGFNGGSPIYYTRGSSPYTATGVINVGAIRAGKNDGKSISSNCGPGVDLFAPGAYITSSWLTSAPPTGTGYPNPVPDPRNTNYYIAKYSGTSMACPQVTGMLACELEKNPTMTPSAAFQYVVSQAKKGQIPDTGGGYADGYSLQGAPNLYQTLPPDLKSA
jgi:hypothetical protein